MATAFEKREKALENKYFHDTAMQFQVISRRRKLLGLWAANQLHMDGEQAAQYAMEIVRYGVEDNAEGAVVRRILRDLERGDVHISEEDVRDHMADFHTQAEEMILNLQPPKTLQ